MVINIEKLNKSGLRKFGLTTGALIAVLFGGTLPWMLDYGFPLWPWLLFSLSTIVALAIPMALQPVYLLWMKFGFIMNWINTRLILGLLFYGIFMPVGLLFKFTGRDTMHRKLDKELRSYRKIVEKDSSDNMEHPY